MVEEAGYSTRFDPESGNQYGVTTSTFPPFSCRFLPMLTVPFLTDLDSRAAVKGSRDPLGIQQIWTRFGRYVVGNLTTVSNSVRDFTTLILGYHFAEQLSHELGPGTELSTFLKWEQLAAYARAVQNKDFSFRGVERVRKNLAEGSRICLSDDRSHQILGNQKIYGLWGLYTMPSRASGIVEGDPSRLTPPAAELVEQFYLPRLQEDAGRDAKRIREALRPKLSRMDVANGGSRLVRAVATVLRRRLLTREREFYCFHLLHSGPQDETAGRQQQLAELIRDSLKQKDFAWSPATVGQLAKTAKAKGEAWHPLSFRLHRIRACESVVAPASALFTHLLGLDGKSVKSVTQRLQSEWGDGLRTIDVTEFQELRSEISGGDSATGDRWVEIANALSAGKYAALLRLLIEQNKVVMASRGGAPWVEERTGKLHIRFLDEQGDLPSKNSVASMWRFPYFLDSLRSVAGTLEEN
jgi:hypothetical protein